MTTKYFLKKNLTNNILVIKFQLTTKYLIYYKLQVCSQFSAVHCRYLFQILKKIPKFLGPHFTYVFTKSQWDANFHAGEISSKRIFIFFLQIFLGKSAKYGHSFWEKPPGDTRDCLPRRESRATRHNYRKRMEPAGFLTGFCQYSVNDSFIFLPFVMKTNCGIFAALFLFTGIIFHNLLI